MYSHITRKIRMENLISSKCNRLIVVGMEFGIAYSGYALSLKHNWSNTSFTRSNGLWRQSCKIPSVLLLSNRTEFIDFGFDAEDKYASFKDNGNDKDYYLFKGFGRIFYNRVRIDLSILRSCSK